MKETRLAFFRAGFLAPAVILYGLFVFWPLLQSFQLAFYRLSGLSDKREFVGFDNFVRIFTVDEGVWFKALTNNLLLLVGAVTIIMIVGMFIAHVAQGKSRMAAVVRSVYLIPHMISIIIVGILWTALFNPTVGPVNGVVAALGIKGPDAWLGSSDTALLAVTIAFAWYILGFGIMVLAAGLKSIPEDVSEAADIDGARGAKKFWSITWPLIWPMRRLVVLHTCIGALNTFALVRLMTNAGPNRATETTLTYLYERGFNPNSYFGEATAIAILNLIVAMILFGIVRIIFGRSPTEARS